MMGAGEPAEQAAPLRGIKVIEFTHMVMGTHCWCHPGGSWRGCHQS
jgi:hypothetical protein